MASELQRRVACRISVDVTVASRLAVAVEVASGVGTTTEQFRTLHNGQPLLPTLLGLGVGGRISLLDAPPGRVDISYEAAVADDAPPQCAMSFGPDQFVALRQSRYCPSDRLDRFASSTFEELLPPGELARRVGDWVFNRLEYTVGWSRPADSAVDTLLSGKGVCRDFAHLTITLCRALSIPARLVSVYAPGLSPMDFHAVAEIWDGTAWEIIDSTRLAPRSSLVRIATGRDAADTAFLSVLSGDVVFVSSEVFAVVDGPLPVDDHRTPVSLAGSSGW